MKHLLSIFTMQILISLSVLSFVGCSSSDTEEDPSINEEKVIIEELKGRKGELLDVEGRIVRMNMDLCKGWRFIEQGDSFINDSTDFVPHLVLSNLTDNECEEFENKRVRVSGVYEYDYSIVYNFNTYSRLSIIPGHNIYQLNIREIKAVR